MAGLPNGGKHAAKPAITAFCKILLKHVAAHNVAARHFFTRQLELALQQFKLATVTSVGSAIPTLPGEEPSAYLLPQEGHHGLSPELEAVRNEASNVLQEPEAVPTKNSML
jgi:hypothetical protein